MSIRGPWYGRRTENDAVSGDNQTIPTTVSYQDTNRFSLGKRLTASFDRSAFLLPCKRCTTYGALLLL